MSYILVLHYYYFTANVLHCFVKNKIKCAALLKDVFEANKFNLLHL